MITFIWDSAYESVPSDQVPRDTIQWEIQKGKIGVEDRMNVQHVWDSVGKGIHRKGWAGTCMIGDDTADVTNPREGSLYLYDDGGSPNLYKIMMYHGGAWIELTTLDHGTLTGLLDDDHPQYLKNGTHGVDVVTSDLLMGDQLLVPLADPGGSYNAYGGLLLYGHKKHSHYPLGAHTVVKADSIYGANLISSVYEVSGTVGPWTQVCWGLPSRSFLPQILVETSGGVYRVVRICANVNSAGYGLSIANSELSGYSYRLRVRYM